MTVPFELDGAVAVLTGAGSGIGRATAVSLAQRGVRLVVSDVDRSRADETAAIVSEGGGNALSVSVDVAERAGLEELRDTAMERFGQVDIVMNNVGVLAMGPAESMPMAAWERVFDLNVFSIARSNLVFLPLLLEQGRGHVINTASASGLLAYGFDRLPYVASKHAVVGLSEALALYLAPQGVGLTCVCPSGVITNIVEQITSYGSSSTPRAPAHPLVEADEVGEAIAVAVESGTFLVVTAPQIHEELLERASDIEEYMQRMISEQAKGSE